MRDFPPEMRECLREGWDALLSGTGGRVSIVLRTRGEVVASHREHESYYSASTIKLALLVAALSLGAEYRLDLGKKVVVSDRFPGMSGTPFQMAQADDQDDATWERLGATLPLSVLIERMIVDSSNIATNLVLREIGFEPVRRVLQVAGAGGMELRHYIGDVAAREAGQGNAVTAESLARLMGLLAAERLLSPVATTYALNVLARQVHRRSIPAGLPAGTWAAGKPGWLDEIEHDVELVRPVIAPDYILAVCTDGCGPAADELIAVISAKTWECWTAWPTS